MSMKKKDFQIPEILKHVLADSLRNTADSGVLLIEKNKELFDVLYKLSFSAPYPYSMRSARILQLYCEKHPHDFDPYLQEITEKIKNSAIGGIKRNYLKIIYEFSGIENIEDPGLLVDICFKWLLSPSEDLAVRYYCLEILNKMVHLEPLLKNEFLASLDLVIKTDNTSIRSRAMIVLHALQNE